MKTVQFWLRCPKTFEEFPRKVLPSRGVTLCFILPDRREICMPGSFLSNIVGSFAFNLQTFTRTKNINIFVV